MLVVIAELAGLFACESASALTDLDPLGIFAGTWFCLAGLVVAAVAS